MEDKFQPNIDNLINCQGSMTALLRNTYQSIDVKIIHTGFDIDDPHIYKRYVTINHNNIPILLAVSYTDIKYQHFYNILIKAGNKSIGDSLFAVDSYIVRDYEIMKQYIDINELPLVLQSFLNNQHFNTHLKIIKRESKFYYQEEILYVVEYIPIIS